MCSKRKRTEELQSTRPDPLNSPLTCWLFTRSKKRMEIENGDGVGSGEDLFDLAALNTRIKQWQEAANDTPDSEMGNLSPSTVHRLLHEPWGDVESIIQFQTDLHISEFAGAIIFRRVRRLLEIIHAAGGVKATPNGNLTRALVREFLEDPEMDASEWIRILRDQKAVNEEDFFPLHVAKLVCRCAGLLRLHRGRLGVTVRGSSLLGPDRAGELFVRLFTGCFRKFNLAYAYRPYLDVPALQRCAAYSLYRLREEARDWNSFEALYPRVFLPAVREQLETKLADHSWMTPAESAGGRIFEPLLDFGLLQGRYKRRHRMDSLEAVRIAPLFERVLRFGEQPPA